MNIKELNAMVDLCQGDSNSPTYPLGFEEAVLGITTDLSTNTLRLIVSSRKVIKILQERDGMSYDEAIDFYEFNIVGSRSSSEPLYMEGPLIE